MEALQAGKRVYDIVLERKLLDQATLDDILKPELLTAPRARLR